jgi:hypothetical protein
MTGNSAKKFYVVTNDELKAKSRLTNTFRTEFENIQIKDFVVEIFNDQLIIGNRENNRIGIGNWICRIYE